MRYALLLFLTASIGLAPMSTASAGNGLPGSTGDDAVQVSGDPDDFTLSAAYPNPFNPRTSFSLTVHERQEVTVEIFNLLGVRVKRLFSGEMEAGETRSFTFSADDLPSGIYLYRAQGNTFTATRQMTLLK